MFQNFLLKLKSMDFASKFALKIDTFIIFFHSNLLKINFRNLTRSEKIILKSRNFSVERVESRYG